MSFWLATLTLAFGSTTGGLPRFPDLADDRVVFTAGGDLWTVGIEGGAARRLTHAPGVERFARVSPDGRWVAYTAEYQGDSDVWVTSIDGGTPRRLTWHAAGWNDDLVWDWTPDGKSVLFSSGLRSPTWRYQEYWTVPFDGGLPTALPLTDAGPASFAPDGSLVFNRVMNNFWTWKRYAGGQQPDLWRWDPKANVSARITDFEGTDTWPMVHADGTVYFVSDRPRESGGLQKANLFKLGPDGKAEALTRHTTWDVSWPSLRGDRLVYVLGGDLRILDTKTGKDEAIDLQIPDEALGSAPTWQEFSDTTSFSVGPLGKRVSVIAHGDLFAAPAKNGAWRALATGSAGRVTEAAWSPKGEKVAFISDESGEQEVWTVDQSGTKKSQKLTRDNDTWIEGLTWAPSGKRLLYTDKRMRLWDVDASTGNRTLVDTGTMVPIDSAVYSADGSYIAYVRQINNGHGAIWLYNVETKVKTPVTDGYNDDYEVAWDPQGRYLYFASRRAYDLITNVFELRAVHRNTDLVYAVRLTKDAPDPIKPLSDEEITPTGEPDFVITPDEKAEDKRKKRKKDKLVVPLPPTMKVDLAGIEARVQRLPLEAGRYSSLQATEDHLYFLAAEPIESEGHPQIKRWVLEDNKVEDVKFWVDGYQLSAGGDKILYASGSGGIYLTDAKSGADDGDAIPGYGYRGWVEPRLEWKRTLDEVRRYYRDYFYDPGLHGHDWNGIHAQYAGLLGQAANDSDVRWLLGEMVAELNVGHAYVMGGWDGVYRVQTGFLGADLERVADGVKISRILGGESGDPARTPPLRAPGVTVSEGDYLLSVDGHKIGPADNPFQWLVGTVGRPVRIQTGKRADGVGALTSTVYPVDSEEPMRYSDWVQANRQRVDKLSGGRVGYVHVPNTSEDGYVEFIRGLYAQYRKDGLVVDVRYNAGGFIPDLFFEPFLRPHLNTWVPRDGADWRTPQIAHHGPKACVTNGYSGSGGDAFPHYFRQLGLGPLVGQTTWGGLVGIDNNLSLLIGGGVTAPSFGFVNAQGEWDIEGKGVAPDLAVVDPPEARKKGEDPQLDAALQQVLESLKTWKDPVPARPLRYPTRP